MFYNIGPWLERNVRDKHTSLLGPFRSNEKIEVLRVTTPAYSASPSATKKTFYNTRHLGGGRGGGPESSSDESDDEIRSRNRSADSLLTTLESLLELRWPAALAPSAMAMHENLSCSGV
jgi:hypothetical protein